VDAAGYYDGPPNGDLLGARTEVCNDGHFAVVASQSLTHDGLSNSVLRFGLAKSGQQVQAV